MSIEVIIYIVKDEHGNSHYAVCGDGHDIIQICGMRRLCGTKIDFESEGYHLEGWCKKHELNYKRITKFLDGDVLWNQ